MTLQKSTLEKKEEKNSLAGNRTPVSCVTDRDTHHYTTKEPYISRYEEHEFEECAKMICSATSQIDCTIENMTFQKAQSKQIKNLLGSELNPGLLCDRQETHHYTAKELSNMNLRNVRNYGFI